ncbi:glycosyltransferase family 2 protein [Epilithonimonas sp. UC225_85]|uniref:glycosyltransferase family 2 protein n=1 Tax=Epilithonimonas sp. UC225_85 TaxID=3350167 RepID=UPI0036D2CB8A
MDRIAILLSTYNGELYLEEQIDSIINQDYKNWDLYVRDDGSKDSTIEIIRNYSKQYDNINFLEDDYNKGAALSFMYLLHKVESDYYMFCDQDDVWLENKISSVYNLLKKNTTEKNQPILIFSDAKVVDQNLKIIDNSFWKYNKTPPALMLDCPDYISVFNCAPGCTMIFNKELKLSLYDNDDKLIMHDWYIMIKALKNGIVKYIDMPLMLYRQHQSNVLGASKISFKDRFSKFFNIKNSINSQLEAFRFVRKYTNVNIFEYYKLKLKFNFLRFKINH